MRRVAVRSGRVRIFPRVNRAWYSILRVATATLVLLPGAVRRRFPSAVSNPDVVRRDDEDADAPEAHSEVSRYEPPTEVAVDARPPVPNLAAAADDGFSLVDRASAAARNAWNWARARLNMAASQR